MARRIVICADGTWNTPDQLDQGERRPSNVVKVVRTVRPVARDGTPQILYYHEGVGTSWSLLDRWLGGGAGVGLDQNVRHAYRFLVDNYEDGDELFLFGFSRGAYTVRSLAGLIRNSGILHKRFAAMVPDALDLYRRRDTSAHPKSAEAETFREKYARSTRIKFIGVWDTVGALGVPGRLFTRSKRRRYEFHDVELSSYVDNAFHALAIDERRKPFAPALWKVKDVPAQRVEQTWFAGVHTNVGGGYADSGLSDLAFQWMQERAAQCGLEFDGEIVTSLIQPSSKGALRESMTWFYRLVGTYPRPIGADPQYREQVHPSVLERREAFKGDPRQRYGPQRLEEYLTRTAGNGPGHG
jgi:uncharacterized protein (DUF2235 family)